MFTKLCGDDACRNVVLVTTRWGSTNHNAGQSRERELSREYWSDMLRHGSRMMQYEDSRESAWDIVNSVVERVPLEFVQIQRELVDLHLRLPETQAARALLGELQVLLDQQRVRMRELERHRTPESEENYKETMSRMRLILEQIQELTIPLSLRVRRLFNIR
jgi:hypothetical protein